MHFTVRRDGAKRSEQGGVPRKSEPPIPKSQNWRAKKTLSLCLNSEEDSKLFWLSSLFFRHFMQYYTEGSNKKSDFFFENFVLRSFCISNQIVSRCCRHKKEIFAHLSLTSTYHILLLMADVSSNNTNFWLKHELRLLM
jgi:hypothetical protein